MVIVVMLVLAPNQAGAGDLLSRSVLVGTSRPTAVTTHAFGFTISTSGVIGSVDFEYCTNSPFVGLSCTAPVGFDASAAVLSAQTGVTGFAVDPLTTANRIVLSRAPTAQPIIAATYLFSNITNPSTSSQTTFVRISTYASNDATGPRTDLGSVAFSTSGSVSTQGFVPPYLIFCVGVTVTIDCSSTSGNYINLGILRANQANTGSSQMSTFTNDVSGYVLTMLGNTMTSGTNVIPALATPTLSAPGNSQFGINLRDNSSPDTGNDPFGPGTGVPAADYDIPDSFTFNNGDIVATSPFSTEADIMTVTYLVNVSAGQAPGVYVTTMTYIATVQF
jgi:hypothetical protein